MRFPSALAFSAIAAAIVQCAVAASVVQVDDRFADGDHGWSAFFADYGELGTAFNLDSGLRPLPAEAGQTGQAFMLSGVNRSDDLMMGMTKHLGPADGIVANQSYWVDAAVEFATNAEQGSVGAGGSPAESVIVCIGATPVAPSPRLVTEGPFRYWRLNVDINASGGIDGTPIGNVSNGLPAYQYVIVARSGRHRFPVTASPTGDLWLTELTDSGFEGLTTLYYTRMRYALTPVSTDHGVLANVSTRATVRPGEEVLIAGYAVDGSGAKTLLTRGAGPSLTAHGVAAPLPNPAIRIAQPGDITVAQNDDWENAPNADEISRLGQSVSAFPFDHGSKDAAIAMPFSPGLYTTVLNGVGSATGEALVEVYDPNPADRTLHLLNLSSRATVADDVRAFAGVVIGGSSPARLLVRVLGPSLSVFNIAHPTAAPRVEIFGEQLHVTPMPARLFGGRELAGAVGARVGAYPIGADTADLEFLINLPPGGYSFVFNATSPGIALLEFYLVPSD